MRFVIAALVILLLVLQWKLWFGEHGMRKVWNLRHQVAEQQRINDELRDRNEALAAEVKDLDTGLDAIEERARSELGMIRQGETYFQIVTDATLPSVATTVAPMLGPDLPAAMPSPIPNPSSTTMQETDSR